MTMIGKALMQVVGAVLYAILAATVLDSPGGDAVTLDEWFVILGLGLTAVPVYLIPNTTLQAWAKGIISGFLALVVVLPALLVNGLDGYDWVTVLVAFGTAAGVLAAPAPVHPTTARRVPPVDTATP